MLAMLLMAVLSMPASILTVDDGGSAQFTSIQAAIDAAAPGDVIEIQPGTYAGFTLAKSLTLLGPASGAKPSVITPVFVMGAVDFVIAGLRFDRVSVGGASRGTLHDCSLMATAEGSSSELLVHGEAQLLVSHCGIEGLHDSGGIAALVADAHAAFVACAIKGGHGHSTVGQVGGDGGPALRVDTGSDVMLANCKVVGGTCGEGGYFFDPWNGASGNGVRDIDSLVIARGGAISPGIQYDLEGKVGYSITVVNAVFVASDVSYDPLTTTGGDPVIEPVLAEPYLDLDGDAIPGTFIQAAIHGQPQLPGLLFVGLASGSVELPKLEEPLGLALPGVVIVPFVLPESGVQVFGATLPSVLGVEGTAFRMQAVFPQQASTAKPGTVVVSNPAVAVVRF